MNEYQPYRNVPVNHDDLAQAMCVPITYLMRIVHKRVQRISNDERYEEIR